MMSIFFSSKSLHTVPEPHTLLSLPDHALLWEKTWPTSRLAPLTTAHIGSLSIHAAPGFCGFSRCQMPSPGHFNSFFGIAITRLFVIHLMSIAAQSSFWRPIWHPERCGSGALSSVACLPFHPPRDITPHKGNDLFSSGIIKITLNRMTKTGGCHSIIQCLLKIFRKFIVS